MLYLSLMSQIQNIFYPFSLCRKSSLFDLIFKNAIKQYLSSLFFFKQPITFALHLHDDKVLYAQDIGVASLEPIQSFLSLHINYYIIEKVIYIKASEALY